MRDRHLPRLCPFCTAPMARQEDVCWNCGRAHVPTRRRQELAVPLAADDDRWDDDGGHAAPSRPEPLVGV
jgi:predicted amidophosphoribosyltransferase